MKDKPMVIIITLLGGAVCSICCILNGAGLLWTLLMTLVSLIVFMIIGMIVNSFYTEIRKELEASEREKAEIAEMERVEALRLEEERRTWAEEHPGEPLPEYLMPISEAVDSGNLIENETQGV